MRILYWLSEVDCSDCCALLLQDRQLRLWLGLQEFVNCLMDSTKVPNHTHYEDDELLSDEVCSGL